LVIVRLLVIPLLICGFGFFVVPVAVLLVLFVVTTHTHTHTHKIRIADNIRSAECAAASSFDSQQTREVALVEASKQR
jgi:fatty acid desaturase